MIMKIKNSALEPNGAEPSPPFSDEKYDSIVGKCLNWYNQEKERKDARAYLRDYIKHHSNDSLLGLYRDWETESLS